MDQVTTQRLLNLNRQFYQAFADQFSATRMRLQPGVKRILAALAPDARLLDLGCGNGELWQILQASDFKGDYTGLDFSTELIDIAQSRTNSQHARFIQADLSQDGWDASLAKDGFDAVLAFAVLHHLPGQALRLGILKQVRRLLINGGHFYHSEWQFLNSPRLRKRIQPWDVIGLSSAKVDSGDYLLDWRRGGYGLRYAHHFEEEELNKIAISSGFKVVETFLSDGQDGKLGLYQIWR
jgi:SAM-dependent methyltransferase